MSSLTTFIFFFFNDTATTEIYTLSLHDALPIWTLKALKVMALSDRPPTGKRPGSSISRTIENTASWSRSTSHRVSSCSRSEEHTSELQSPCNLVCRLLLEKKKITKMILDIDIVI